MNKKSHSSALFGFPRSVDKLIARYFN